MYPLSLNRPFSPVNFPDNDDAASDGGYSSDGDLSSMYGAYSSYKTRKHESFVSTPVPDGPSFWQERDYTSIFSPQPVVSKLPNNVLFDIFTFYGEDIFSKPGGHRYWWQTLALVCRKWNTVIRSSPSHFLGELRFGNNSSVLFFMNISRQGCDSVTSLLRRSQLLPIHVNYDFIQPTQNLAHGHVEDNVLVLLQHIERVWSLSLRAPLSTWRAIAAATSDAPLSCTSVEHIHLHTGDRTTGLALPGAFLKGHAPRLRSLTTIGVFLLSLPSLLTSTFHLVYLVLDGIPDSSHLPPEALLTYLSAMPRLQYLNIGFLSTIPPRRQTGNKTATPGPLNRVVLTNLGQFYFRGACAYLEALVAKVDTPHVYDVCLMLFYQLRYALPRVSAFLSRTKRFGFDGVRIQFYPNGVSISAIPAVSPSPKEILCIRIPCSRLDFQVASVAQICTSLKPNFANMEDLFIKYHQSQLSAEWFGEVDSALWGDILAQFRGMKTLWVSSAFVSEVTSSIRSNTQQLLEELPILAWIIVEVHKEGSSVAAARSLSDLLIDIRRSGGPVIEVYRLFSETWNKRILPQS